MLTYKELDAALSKAWGAYNADKDNPKLYALVHYLENAAGILADIEIERERKSN